MKSLYLDRIRRQSTYFNTRDNIDLLVKVLLGLCTLLFLLGFFVLIAGSEGEKFSGVLAIATSVSSAISIKIIHILVSVFFDIADSIIDLNYRYDYPQ